MNGSDPKRQQQEQDWADRIPEDTGDSGDAPEPAYRDGSAVNECWDRDGGRV